MFLDDDGVGYVAFSALGAPNGPLKQGHMTSIERLSSDLLSSSKDIGYYLLTALMASSVLVLCMVVDSSL